MTWGRLGGRIISIAGFKGAGGTSKRQSGVAKRQASGAKRQSGVAKRPLPLRCWREAPRRRVARGRRSRSRAFGRKKS